MSGFWDLSDGSSATTTGTEYETGGGSFEAIPEGSSVLAAPDQVQWASTDAQKGPVAQFIEIRWVVIAPEQYKGRKIFGHKLYVTDLDPRTVAEKGQDKAIAKRDKHRRMLAAIDANAGGKLATNPGVPSNDHLGVALVDKPMVITLMETSPNEDGSTRNWVSAVAPRTKAVEIKPAKPKKPASGGGYGGGGYGGGGYGAPAGGGYGQPSAGGYVNTTQTPVGGYGAPAGGGYGGQPQQGQHGGYGGGGRPIDDDVPFAPEFR